MATDKVDFKGTLGWIANLLAVLSITGLFVLLKRQLEIVLAIWNSPPTSAFPAYYLLLLLAPLAVGVIVFQSSLGSLKAVRLLVGLLGVVTLYLITLAFFMSWSAEMLYYPILDMDLGSFAGAGYEMQAARSALTLPILIFFVIYAALIYALLNSGDFWNQFFTWRLEGLLENIDNSVLSTKEGATDVVLCIDEKSKKPVIWYEVDQPTNLGIIGPVGSGKTTMVIVPILAQFLTNDRLGVLCIEPKGDLTSQLAELAEKSGRKYIYIDPREPNCPVFNPLEGEDPDIVAEVNKNALIAQFGKQDPFFSKNQAVAARNVILLLKYLRGNNCTLVDLIRCLEDDKEIMDMVKELERKLPVNLPYDDSRKMLIHWFRNEYFGDNAKEFKKFTMGLRIQIEEMMSNNYFKKVTCGKSSFDMYEVIEKGYDVFVNTNDGILGDRLSSALGIFILQYYQAAIQKRGPLPPTGKEREKYKLSVCALDEFGGYVNEEYPKFLSKARGYGVITILAMQSTSQLLRVGGINNTGFRDDVLTNLRSMIIFGGITFSDAKYFSDNFGKQEEEMVSKVVGYNRGRYSWFIPDSANQGTRSQIVEKEIYNPTEIMYLKANRVYYRVMQNRSLQKPGVGMVDWFNREKSSIGGVYWFDNKKFEERVREIMKNKEGKGLLARLGIEFGKSKDKDRESAAKEGAAEDMIYSVPDNSVASAFRFSDDTDMPFGTESLFDLERQREIQSLVETRDDTDIFVLAEKEKENLDLEKEIEALGEFGWNTVDNFDNSNQELEPNLNYDFEDVPNDADDILNKI